MKSIKLLFAISAVSAALVCACSKPDPVINPDGNEVFTPIGLTKAEQGISTEINGFGQELFRNIYRPQNQMISPLSVSLAFSMAAFGAEGESERQICSVLGFEDYNSVQISGYYKKMLDALKKADKKTVLNIANSIWAADDYTVLDAYKQGTRQFYNSETFNVDFSASGTKDKINSWVSENTAGKIDKLVEHFSPDTRMLLINAMYFNGMWANHFDSCSKRGSFVDIDGNKNELTMMDRTCRGWFSSYDGYEMAELTYGNSAFEMDVILPPSGMPFKEAVASFDEKVYSSLIDRIICYELYVKMPPFKFESSMKLAPAMKAMGMEIPFDADKADFSKIGPEGLFIEDAVHKTYIDVNKEGTEAAAITGMIALGTGPVEFQSKDFIVDRPFLFVIRETSTNTILFIGQKVR